MLNIKKLKNDDYITTSWSGGKTTQIIIYPEDSIYKELNFKFRISSATVELEKSEFTKLDNVHRFITPLDNPLKLTHNEKDYIDIVPFQVYEFDGGIDTTSFGMARDFNLMLANGAKGSLENILVERYKEMELNLSNEEFILFFNYDNEVAIKINNEDYILHPMESLLLNTSQDISLKLEFEVIDRADILMSKVKIWQ